MDAIKEQLQASLESQLPQWASETGPQVAQLSVAQLAHPATLEFTLEALGTMLAEAASIAAVSAGPVMQQAICKASDCLTNSDMLAFVGDLTYAVASENRPKAAAQVDAKVAMPTANFPIRTAMEQAAESVLLQSHRQAVRTLSHHALLNAVENTLQQSVLPYMMQLVLASYRDYLERQLQAALPEPAVAPQTREASLRAARKAAGDTMTVCLQKASPVVVPVPAAVPVANAAAGAAPSSAAPSSAALNSAPTATPRRNRQRLALSVRPSER